MIRGPRPEGSSEEGSASVLGVQVISMLAVVTLVCCGVAALFADHRRAQSAADLGALAAATALQQGDPACAAATRIVAANDAELRRCVVLGQTVAITVVVRSPPLLGRHRDLAASARAGPVGGPVSGPVGDSSGPAP